jgi:hypothetical protein
VHIPVTSLLSIGGGLLDLLKKKAPLAITVKTITTIDLGWKKIPYSKADVITIKPKAS